MLNAVALENGQLAVVQFDGDLHLNLAARHDEQLAHAGGQLQQVGGLVEILAGAVERFHRVPIIEIVGCMSRLVPNDNGQSISRTRLAFSPAMFCDQVRN
jgi:hypothetical protein